MASRMNIGRRRKFRQNWLNKVRWGIEDRELTEVPHRDRIVPMIKEQDLDDFKERCDEIMETEMKINAPYYLQFGGHVIALIVSILGCIAITESSAGVGAVLFVLGFLLFGLAFWYRDQLISKAWKRIGQQFQSFFREFGEKTPGVAYEFHVQGKHQKHGERRAMILYERYIIIYLPGNQHHYHTYVEDQRSANEIINSDSKAKNTFKPELDDNPVVLPYWWATAQDQSGKTYFINNLKHRTQWTPPSLEQIEMEKAELEEILAPPGKSDDESDDEDQDQKKESYM